LKLTIFCIQLDFIIKEDHTILTTKNYAPEPPQFGAVARVN